MSMAASLCGTHDRVDSQRVFRPFDRLRRKEDSARRLEDSELLDRCNELQRVLVSQHIDLLRIAGLRNKNGVPFEIRRGILLAELRGKGSNLLCRKEDSNLHGIAPTRT